MNLDGDSALVVELPGDPPVLAFYFRIVVGGHVLRARVLEAGRLRALYMFTCRSRVGTL